MNTTTKLATTTASSSSTSYASLINSIDTGISFYFLAILTPVGVICNTLSTVVLMRPNMNKTNMGFLFSILATLDTITLLYYTLVGKATLFGFTANFDPCGMSGYIRRTLFNLCSWLQVTISLERFINVFYANRYKFFHSKKFYTLVMLGFTVLILVTNVTLLISSQVTRTTFNNATNKTVTTTSCFSTPDMSLASSFISILMRIYIPLVIMVVLNVLIIRKMFMSRNKVQTSKTVKSNSKEYRFTIMTCLLDIIFWIFYAPVSVWLTASIVNNFYPFINSSNSVSIGLFTSLSQTFAAGYHGIFFFTNIGLNKLFRKELFIMLRLKKTKRNQTDTMKTNQTNYTG